MTTAPAIHNTDWVLATTLRERIKKLPTTDFVESNSGNDWQKLLLKWKNQEPFTNRIYWEKRLELDQLSESTLAYILNESTDSLASRLGEVPNWVTQLFHAQFNDIQTQTYWETEDMRKRAIAKFGIQVKFLVVIKPLLQSACQKFNYGINQLKFKYKTLPFNLITIEKICLMNLPTRLIALVRRTLTLEIQVARLQGKLKGDTSAERFEYFIQQLEQADVVHRLFAEYPVMARQLTTEVNKWVDFHLELLQHLCEDQHCIEESFQLTQSIGSLIELDSELGDAHRLGRSVTKLEFDSGFRLIYKPRSVAIDKHFQNFITYLNSQIHTINLPILRIVERNNHGWVQYVKAEACKTRFQVQKFYQRIGGYLAILYLLDATDFHFENIIASTEYPFLIDLESLFQPRIKNNTVRKVESLSSDSITQSVMRVQLLPNLIWNKQGDQSFDISGLSNLPNQLTPEKVMDIEQAGTDQMRCVYKKIGMGLRDNRPRLDNNNANVFDYLEEMITGFIEVYKQLLALRDFLLSPCSPLKNFVDAPIRVLLRDTNIYHLLLSESVHPNLLRNALERDKFFDRLWLAVKDTPCLSQIIPYEQIDLWYGDIPIFTTTPTSYNLWTSDGKKISRFLETTGMEQVIANLHRLSEDDMEQQIWFIRASAATYAGILEPIWKPLYHFRKTSIPCDRSCLLAMAKRIGDRLELISHQNEQIINWVGITSPKEKQWQISGLDLDLYEGLPGITLFLAYLGHITGEVCYTRLAQKVTNSIYMLIEQHNGSLFEVGAWKGWGGIIYTFAHLAYLWKEEKLAKEAERLVKKVATLAIEENASNDKFSQSSCIAGLLSLYSSTPSCETLDVAIQYAKQLIVNINSAKEEDTVQQQDSRLTSENLWGKFEIANTLFTLARISNDEQFHEKALHLLEGESLPPSKNVTPYYLACVKYMQNLNFQASLPEIISTINEHNFGVNHSLESGDLGSLEFLLQAGILFDNQELVKDVYCIATSILESIEHHGWLCGTPMNVETPGFMRGLAGIGYGLLRLASPEQVPSILTLEPPTSSQLFHYAG